ncbi:MAG: class III cytochrome C domain protein [Oligoflexia bacterium]|nr:MAG: class III cytochrome C domain protein [Oligoflexia bacterium]
MHLAKKTSVLALVVGVLFLTGCKFQYGIGYNQGYSPEQPIPFDHSIHVGQNGIQCQYCHNQVERSNQASIPALSTCMNCHMLVRGDSPFVQKIQQAHAKGESIQWVKVHMLPEHVKFSHSAHVQKGVNCQTCHGPIETMQKVSQFSDLSMGWCVNCHRQPENKAPLNCSTCHH